MNREDYPAKLVQFRPNDYEGTRTPVSFPSPAKWEYNSRNEVIKHFMSLKRQLDFIIKNYIPEAKVKLKKSRGYYYPLVLKMKKLAKSHRPEQVMNELYSEVIAVHALGKLVVGIQEDSLHQFIAMIDELIKVVPSNRDSWIEWAPDRSGKKRQKIIKERAREYDLIHELTCIELISIYSPAEVLETMGIDDYKDCEKDGKFKIRFFSYDDRTNSEVLDNFLFYFNKSGLVNEGIDQLKYSNNISTYVVPYANKSVIQQMAAFPGVESISSFTRFKVTNANLMFDTHVLDVLQPEQSRSYPKVALVDSGIGFNNRHIVMLPIVKTRFSEG